ncbi:hypothetical protein N869_11385, partial [Cellulomonas bogoriensis 69B4 = DSM 16987]
AAADVPAVDLTALSDLDDALDEAGAHLADAREALADATSALDPQDAEAFAPVGTALDAVSVALDRASGHTDRVAVSVAEHLDAVAGSLVGVADDLDAWASTLGDLAAVLPGGPGPVPPVGERAEDLDDAREHAQAVVDALTALHQDVLERLEDLEQWEDLTWGDLLRDAVDVPEVARQVRERLVERLAGVGVDLDLPTLGELLEGESLTVAELLDALGLDPTEVFAGVDLGELLGDVDLAEELAQLLQDADVTFPDVQDLLAGAGADLTEVLADVDLTGLLGGVDLPDLQDAFGDVDLDLEGLLAAAGLEPGALLDDLALPDAQDLLAGADVQDLLGGAGLDELGDLDQMVDMLAEGIAMLATGADELADGLDALADEGLGRLVAQLDEGNVDALQSLALISALDDRAEEARGVAYTSVAEVPDRWTAPLLALALLAALTAAAEALRRRWT